MKPSFAAAIVTLIASVASAQTPLEGGLTTRTGHDLSLGIASYTYDEPGHTAISIHGVTFAVDYTGTRWLSARRHWFAGIDARGVAGSAAYDGWCSPFIITPDSASPNGYALDVGDPSPCSETGDKDWYVEARALTGKDLIGGSWGWSPFTGLGLRHLSNGTSGIAGYRTDDYLYLPLGLTSRTNLGSRRTLALAVEVDALLHGWQNTHDSALGGGDVPATPTAPAFTIDGFSDVSFSQSGGWALRASASVPMTASLSLEPYYVRWSVTASPVNYETATFTVNNVTAREQMGAYEPFNTTNEIGVRLGFHF